MENTTGLIDTRPKESFFSALLICVFFILVFIQMSLVSFSARAEKNQLFVILCFFVGLVQLLLSIEIVFSSKKYGSHLAILLNSIHILFAVLFFFIKKEMMMLPQIAVCGVGILICIILSRQYAQILRNVGNMHRLAYTDELTGLPNRTERLLAIDRLISGSKKVPSFSLALFDLDNFRIINDTLGHNVGDLYISEIVHNMKSFVSQPASIGRMGEDEFLLILPGSMSEEELESYVLKICHIISQPFRYRDHDFRMTTSVGIVRYPKDSATSVSLLQQLDIALYRAKSQGKDKITFFDEKMQFSMERKMDIENRLATAVERKELYVEYQPQYRMPNRQLYGFEALVRWSSPQLGEIAPLDFIPIAEENGMIVRVGEWVLREACTQYMRIYPDYECPPMLSVNVSVVQMRDPGFIDKVRNIIKETKMDTEYLEVEITESVFIKSPEMARQILTELRKMGIKIALDDFGTGYSSLSYLRTLPFDIVKIDKSFIDTIGVVPEEKNLVKSIIEMAHNLGLKVISEGIERCDQLDYLVQHKCDIIQGNLLGRPVPAAGL
ncbi:MAG: bifunctional diguanylate cyclase/phosphodiesterase [Treponema sp.]|nr:bifunctional diguanylate cyclase/phosphodiesterase [Treponema sp.]